MNISKISRSIVVVIFVVSILFLSYLNISNMLGGEVASNVTSNLLKVGFVFAVIFLVSIYMYIKDKLYKKHVKRKISFIYRYIYIVLVILAGNVLSIKYLSNISFELTNSMIMINTLVTLAISLVIKRIVFNVSKSDILSVLGMFTYSLLPKIIIDKSMYFSSMAFTLVFFLSILVLQILIDELKQKGIKTNKYIVESILLGFGMGICSTFGVNIFVWIILAFVMLFITYNLDNTHISFPKAFMASLTQSKRESLYKIERININKIIVSIIVMLIIMLLVNFMTSTIITKMNNNYIIAEFSKIINSNIEDKSNIANVGNNFVELGRNLVTSYSRFYMSLFVYIIFMEGLAFFLRRRYDTKSTVMKVIFILLLSSIAVLNLNIFYFQPIFTILLILTAIVNTLNIYLNREERIKMLVA